MAVPSSPELSFAQCAVTLASRLCQSVRSSISAEAIEKRDRSPVTIADFGSQAIVCRALAESFPDDVMIAEEDSAVIRGPETASARDRIRAEMERVGVTGSEEEILAWIDRGGHASASGRFWTLDPIDGTKGFLRGEQYAISLAMLIDGRLELAVVGCPNLPVPGSSSAETGGLFFAVRGEGAWAMPLGGPLESATRLSVSSVTSSDQARFCESVESGHSAHDVSAQIAARLGMTLSPERLDSQAKYAVVASGRADIYLRMPTRADYQEKIWDHAGGALLVEEAGGRVTDLAGQPLNFARGRELSANRGIVVTNGALHEAVLAAVDAVVSSDK